MPRTVWYSIDLMKGDRQTADLVHEIIDRYDLQHNVIWGANHADVHAYLRELNPEIALYYPESEVISTLLWHIFGCLWFRKLSNDALMVPVMTSEEVARRKRFQEFRNDSNMSFYTIVISYKLL